MFVAKDKSFRQVLAMKRDIEAAIAPSGLRVLYVISASRAGTDNLRHLNIILTTICLSCPAGSDGKRAGNGVGDGNQYHGEDA